MEYIFDNDLRSEEVTTLCSNIYHFDKPENVTANEYIRWFILDEQEMAFVGGESLYTEYDFQVDIYTTGSYIELAKAIKNTLKSKRYTVIENKNSVVTKGDIKLYNKTLRFRYNKYNVKEGIK